MCMKNCWKIITNRFLTTKMRWMRWPIMTCWRENWRQTWKCSGPFVRMNNSSLENYYEVYRAIWYLSLLFRWFCFENWVFDLYSLDFQRFPCFLLCSTNSGMLWCLSYFTIWESEPFIMWEPLVREEILAGLGFSEGKLDSLEGWNNCKGKQKQVGL